MRRLILLAAALGLAGAAPGPDVAARFTTLNRATKWAQVAAVPLRFPTFHPQGMVRIGDVFYVSSVEVRTRPIKYAAPQDGHDRDTGAGVGHLFKVSADGRLLADTVLGEGAIYHPGGMDYDGRWLWVPVAEYRPDSRAIVYRVDPATMRAEAVFRWDDHIGGLVHDRGGKALVGISWGSRRMYRWPMREIGAGRTPKAERYANPAQYIDYQDCHYLPARRMLCGGVADYAQGPGATAYVLGGLELVDLKTRRAIWQLPVELRAPSGRPMTQNPFWLEATAQGLRAWFMPDDDTSTLYAFETGAP